MLRYLATLGYGALAIISMLWVVRGGDPWFWAVILLFSPVLWFWLVGVEAQWQLPEVIAFVVLGITGVICSWLLGVQFGGYYPLGNTGDIVFLFMFWGTAGLMSLKVGGSLFAIADHRRYDKDYLLELSEPTPSWHWAPALVGVIIIAGAVWQLFRLA